MAVRAISKLVKIDEENKYIFCDMDNVTDGALKTVQMYLGMGYHLNPPKHSGDKRDKQYWLDRCESKAQRDKFEAICKGKTTIDGKKGYFTAKKWLQEELEKKSQ